VTDPHRRPLPARRPWRKGGVLHADLCVIGAGSGGLSVAAGAAQMGAAVVLIEKHRMGGDCLNTGCVPSKALLAAAHAAEAVRRSARFGITAPPPEVEFGRVQAHVHGVIAAIAPHDSVERFEGLGVTVILAPGRFTGPAEVEAGGERIRARRFVIATGSSPALPPVPGLADVPFLTNEAVFDLTALPAHLVVLGAGPIGVEMAQAFRRLGASVSLIDIGTILPRDEPEAVAIIRSRLVAEGVSLHERATVAGVSRAAAGVAVSLGDGRVIEGTHLLVATGRRPRLEGLGLEAAGIAATARGITVDRALRTTNRRVYAIGDSAGGPQFTHIAAYHAGLVLRSALLGLPVRADYRALPWVTYTDPELAHVGLTEAEARRAGYPVSVLLEPLSGNDRARTEGEAEGLAKIVLGRRGRVLGATIVAPHAGEVIGLWGLAIQRNLRIGAIAALLAPYPTLGELSKRAAGNHFAPLVFGPWMRRLVGLTQRLLP